MIKVSNLCHSVCLAGFKDIMRFEAGILKGNIIARSRRAFLKIPEVFSGPN